jgi:uncharacterized membrane protein YesL
MEVIMKIISIDSPIMSFLNKVSDIIILNILYIVFSLPIITIGATTTASFAVTSKLIKDGEISIIRAFFSEFKRNFKTSTLCWLIMIIMGSILIFDFLIAFHFPSTLQITLRIMVVMLGLIYLFTFLYLFQYIANFKSKMLISFKNSILLSIAKLPYTLLFIIIILLCVTITYIAGLFVSGPFWTLFGFGFIIYLTTPIYSKIFNSIDTSISACNSINENF